MESNAARPPGKGAVVGCTERKFGGLNVGFLKNSFNKNPCQIGIK